MHVIGGEHLLHRKAQSVTNNPRHSPSRIEPRDELRITTGLAFPHGQENQRQNALTCRYMIYKLLADKETGIFFQAMTTSKLQHELKKKRPFESLEQEAALSIVRT